MGGGSGYKTAAGRLDHGGFWRRAADWPLPGTQWARFHLRADRSLSEALPEESAAPLSFTADPHNPVPTIGGAISSGEPVMRAGAYDQRTGPNVFGARPSYAPLAARPDVLSLATAPLAADREVAGPIEMRLWVASDRLDCDIHAKLVDLYPANADYPEGLAMNLTEGLLRLRYRQSWEKPDGAGRDPCRDDRAVPDRQSVPARPSAPPRPRGSNFPHFDVNRNSGEPEVSSERPLIATNRIFVDRGHPSHLVLPAIPPTS